MHKQQYPILGYSKIGFRIFHMSTIHSKEYQAIIERLIKARKDANLTQKEVAKKLNKPQSYVSKVENHQRRLDILELKEFAGIYKVSLNDLTQ